MERGTVGAPAPVTFPNNIGPDVAGVNAARLEDAVLRRQKIHLLPKMIVILGVGEIVVALAYIRSDWQTGST